jgi:predicted Fe-Mo cluster-binding NifX family protein
MKVAVSSIGKGLESKVSTVFGRCPYFIIAEIEGRKIQKIEAVENMSAGQKGGAGISAAREVAERGAKSVITGNLGPRASDVFKQFGIEAYKGSGSVKEALEEFMAGTLEKIK